MPGGSTPVLCSADYDTAYMDTLDLHGNTVLLFL